MTAVDRVLETIDAGLQSSAEGGLYLDPTRCTRCQIVPVPKAVALCGDCRAFLLGDGPSPEVAAPVREVNGESVMVRLTEDTLRAFVEAVDRLSEHVRDCYSALMGRSVPAKLAHRRRYGRG